MPGPHRLLCPPKGEKDFSFVGFSSFLYHQIDDSLYTHLHEYLKSHIQDRNTPADDDTAKEFIEADDGTLVPVGEEGKLSAEKDFKFFMYRHWSLYDSMYYSPYVASRLVVWKQRGKNRFQELLAKMGVSLEQCRQKWTFMPQVIKDRVRENLKVSDCPNLFASCYW